MILRGIDGNDYAIILRSNDADDNIKYFEAYAGTYTAKPGAYLFGHGERAELVCSVTIPVRPTKRLKEAAKAKLFRLLIEAGRICETPIELRP